jgi:hypothetical protein
MVSQTDRTTAICLVTSRLTELAAEFNKQHGELDRVVFRDLCRQLYEPLEAVVKIGLADKRLEVAIRHCLGYLNNEEESPSNDGRITIDLSMICVSEDPKADSVLELVGYNKLHDWIEDHQGESEVVARKAVLKPGRIAETSLGLTMPTYYRHVDGSISDLAPRRYAQFCQAIIEVLRLPLPEIMQPGEAKQHDAPTLLTIETEEEIHPPVADHEEESRFQDLFAKFDGYWDSRLTPSQQTTLTEYLSQPQSEGGRRKPKTLVRDMNAGVNGLKKNTQVTSPKNCYDLKKRVKKWFDSNITTDLAFEPFMIKFAAWRNTSKPSQKSSP